MANNYGKRFESNFRDSCIQQGYLVERFQDSNKFGTGQGTRFTMTSPCDFLIFDGNYLFYIELKSSLTGSISFNNPPDAKTEKTVSIKPHQIKALLQRNKYANVVCGLVLDFADRKLKHGTVEGGCYFIEIDTFYDWVISCEKNSINKEDAERIGIEVPREKKKVNYSYDIDTMIEQIVKYVF